jgi:hypothetical protein
LEREIAPFKKHGEIQKGSEEAAFSISALPNCENTLKDELEGYWSLPIGRTRIIYRPR